MRVFGGWKVLMYFFLAAAKQLYSYDSVVADFIGNFVVNGVQFVYIGSGVQFTAEQVNFFRGCFVKMGHKVADIKSQLFGFIITINSSERNFCVLLFNSFVYVTLV